MFGFKKPTYAFGVNLKTSTTGELLVELCEIERVGKRANECVIRIMTLEEFEALRERMEDISKAIDLIQSLHCKQHELFKGEINENQTEENPSDSNHS